MSRVKFTPGALVNLKNKIDIIIFCAFLISHLAAGLPGSGLGDDRDPVHRGAAPDPPLHHVLLCGQQLVQSPLP